MDLKIPDRWLACPQRSKLIAGKFVVFKTPLDCRYDKKVGRHKFNFDILIKSLQENKLRLKMVIDMTFTDRYYDSSDLAKRGIHYVKLKCRGREEAPDADSKVRFIEEVNKFKADQEGDVIGVHCTHGFNRSGFMVVSYLVEEYDSCLDSAMVEFKKARYPGIYKEEYVHKLCEVYSMEKDDVPDIPANLPSWVTDKDSNDHPEIYNTTKTFMDGLVPDVDTLINTEEVLAVQKAVQTICAWKKSGFPGGQPVSMSVNNMNKLTEVEYKVSWKADGTRFLMYIEKENDVFLLDRNNTVFKARRLKFPWGDAHLYATLIDGEMVIDTYQGMKIPRFLAYDIIKLQEDQVGDNSLEERQHLIRCMVNERNCKVDKSRESFSFRLKEFWHVKYAAKLLADPFKKSLNHEMDGLIFQPANMPYMTGQCEDILKWKPPGLNSVDFKVEIGNFIKEGWPLVKVAKFYCGEVLVFTMKYTKEFKDLDKKIVECHWDAAGKTWKFMRERTDKSYPNAYETYTSICNTINDPVTQENLLALLDNTGPKRPAPQHKAKPPDAKRQKTGL